MFYIQASSGITTTSDFRKVVQQVYAGGLRLADLVLRGNNEEGNLMYDSESGWVFDELSTDEIDILRQFTKKRGDTLRLI